MNLPLFGVDVSTFCLCLSFCFLVTSLYIYSILTLFPFSFSQSFSPIFPQNLFHSPTLHNRFFSLLTDCSETFLCCYAIISLSPPSLSYPFLCTWPWLSPIAVVSHLHLYDSFTLIISTSLGKVSSFSSFTRSISIFYVLRASFFILFFIYVSLSEIVFSLNCTLFLTFHQISIYACVTKVVLSFWIWYASISEMCYKRRFSCYSCTGITGWMAE